MARIFVIGELLYREQHRYFRDGCFGDVHGWIWIDPGELYAVLASANDGVDEERWYIVRNVTTPSDSPTA